MTAVAEATIEQRLDSVDLRALARLAAKVDMPEGADGCWLYTGHLEHGGYGQFTYRGRSRIVHRVVYELFVEPVPTDLQLDHLCRVRHCINPDHLEPVTPRENWLRGQALSRLNAAKSACDHGHLFAPENTRIEPNGARTCRTCERAKHTRRRRARQPEILHGAPANLIAAHRGRPAHNTSGYKGVSFHSGRGRWQAYIKTGQRQRYLGLFDTPEAAARAYDAAAVEAWGEYATLNFAQERRRAEAGAAP